MNAQNNRVAWIIVAILAVLLVVALVLWMNAKKDLDQVLMEGRADIVNVRDEVEEDCQGGVHTPECQDALDELENVLLEFRRDVNEATTTEETAL